MNHVPHLLFSPNVILQQIPIIWYGISKIVPNCVRCPIVSHSVLPLFIVNVNIKATRCLN